MSRIINLIATLGATALTGYFIYKVILPGLKDIQLPTLQFPDFSQFQFPTPQQQPQLPQQEEQPQDEEPEQTTDKPTGCTKTAAPPASPPPSAGGAVIWDSNTHGKWNSGGRRVVTKGDGNTNPGGGGLHTAASGTPTLTIDGNGVAHLESSRWGRVYIYAKNYNSRLEGSFMFETDHGAADNISIKMRSRHGHSGHTTAGGGNQFGGIGFAFHPDGEIELAAEITHGGSSYDFGTLRGPALQLGKWHKFAISVYDGGGINVKADVDGRTIGSKKWANPAASAIDKAAFAADSYFWIRLNCHDGKRAKAAFSNLRLVDLGTASTSAGLTMTRYSMLTEPYLYNGYYNRRRL